VPAMDGADFPVTSAMVPGRMGGPSGIGGMALLLASGAGSFITGPLGKCPAAGRRALAAQPAGQAGCRGAGTSVAGSASAAMAAARLSA
jgi:hypothetical protein